MLTRVVRLSHSGWQKSPAEGCLAVVHQLPGLRARPRTVSWHAAGCGVRRHELCRGWQCCSLLILLYGLICRRVSLATHPSSRHTNAPTTSVAPLWVGQGRATSEGAQPFPSPCKALSPQPLRNASPLCWGAGDRWLLASPGRDSCDANRHHLCRTHQGGRGTDGAPWCRPRSTLKAVLDSGAQCGVQGSLRWAVLPLVSQGWESKSVCACWALTFLHGLLSSSLSCSHISVHEFLCIFTLPHIAFSLPDVASGACRPVCLVHV